VRNNRDRRIDLPTFYNAANFRAETLTSCLKVIKRTPASLVLSRTQFFHQIIRQQTVLLELDEVGNDHHFVQDAARLERIGEGQLSTWDSR